MSARILKRAARSASLATRKRTCVFFAELAPTDVAEKVDTAVWVQVALEGTYKGYEGGEFTFEKKTFDTIVANFREHPSYLAGPDGVGSVDVVPWDFHHASELGATSGSVPVMGAPAQGWVRDLEVRTGEGGAELWALTRWLEPARTYILEGKYRWASVTVFFAARDPVSGAMKGPTLMSIALTNKPFIEGMNELVAAERQFGQLLDARENETRRLSYNDVLGLYVEQAKDANDALAQLRKVFGLTQTAGAGDVLQQVTMIEQWVATGGAPLGVNVAAIVGCMRSIFGLPALSSNEDVFLEAHKLMQALIEQQPDPGTGTETTETNAPPQAVATERTNMELLKKLAALLGVTQSEAAVLEAVELNHQLRVALAKMLGLTTTTANAVILDKAGNTTSKLGAILKALGVEDADAAIAKLAETIKQANDLTTAMPELEELRGYKAKQENDVAEADVAAAMKSYSLPESVKDGLMLMRKGKDGAKVFAEKFPKKEPEATTEQTPAAGGALPTLLSRSLTVGPNGQERRVVANPDGGVTLGAPTPAGGANPNPGVTVINLTAMPGRNRTERMVAHVRAQLGDKAKEFTYDDVFEKAIELLHSKAIKVVDANAA